MMGSGNHAAMHGSWSFWLLYIFFDFTMREIPWRIHIEGTACI